MGAPAVSTSPLVRRYRLDEFFALAPPLDGGRYELIAGVLYMSPPPGGPHHIAVSRLNLVLAAYAREHPDRCILFVPSAAVWTPADTYLLPDLFMVRSEQVEAMGAGSLATADLVVEILSPSTAHYDRTTKADTYAALGVRELWLVDLERRTIEQRVLSDGGWRVDGVHAGDTIVRAASFPELTVRVADVFA